VILLAVDTSTRYAGVAVANEDDVLCERVWRSEQNHGAELLPTVMDLLGGTRLTISDFTHFAVALGPGGFSALRVGLSTVKGLALPKNLPLVGISTFDIEAAPHFVVDAPLYAVIPAGRGEVAWAFFGDCPAPVRTSTESDVTTPEDLLTQVHERAVFCGEGTALLAPHVSDDALRSGPPPTRSPAVLVRLARERFARGQVDDPATLEPAYARAPSISTPKPPRT